MGEEASHCSSLAYGARKWRHVIHKNYIQARDISRGPAFEPPCGRRLFCPHVKFVKDVRTARAGLPRPRLVGAQGLTVL